MAKRARRRQEPCVIPHAPLYRDETSSFLSHAGDPSVVAPLNGQTVEKFGYKKKSAYFSELAQAALKNALARCFTHLLISAVFRGFNLCPAG